MTKSPPGPVVSGLTVAVLSLLAGAALHAPHAVLAQSASNSGHQGAVVWKGPQHQSGVARRPQTGFDNTPATLNGQPGYLQQPVVSQPAMSAGTPPGQFPASPTYGLRSGQHQNYGHRRQLPGQLNTGPFGAARPGQFPVAAANPQSQQLTPNQMAQDQMAQDQMAQDQLARDKMAQDQHAMRLAQQRHQQRDPMGIPVLSPAATRFFQNLRGPNLSTWNQNRHNYSFAWQTRPSTRIPGITWQSGSRFGQSYSNRSTHNQTNFNQNRFNYSLRNITAPGFRGYR